MLGIVFKLFAAAIAVVIVLYMMANAFRKARLLDERIKEFKAEQEELARKNGPINPYAALAEIYSEDAQAREKDRHRASRPKR